MIFNLVLRFVVVNPGIEDRQIFHLIGLDENVHCLVCFLYPSSQTFLHRSI